LQEFNHDQLRRALTHHLGHELTPEVAATIECFACSNPAPIPLVFGSDISNEQNAEFYAFANEALQSNYKPSTSRVLTRLTNGRIRGVVVYSDLRKWSVEMSMASDGSSRWINRALLRSAFHFPFVQLGLRRVTGRIESDNTAALAVDEGLGFKREGVQRGQFGDTDCVLMGMLAHECRWINQ
jgi:RimJ/RimL family protein N-acetyltransferase